MPPIRQISICVFRHGDRILVAEGFDGVKRERFYRPLGGAMEFGERSADALKREIREELDHEIQDPILLGVLENVFTYEGREAHETVFVYDATFVDRRVYREPALPIREDVWVGPARWLSLSDAENVVLYPEGLLDLLTS